MSRRGGGILAPRHGESEYQRHPLPGEIGGRRDRHNAANLLRKKREEQEAQAVDLKRQQAAVAKLLEREQKAKRDAPLDEKSRKDRDSGIAAEILRRRFGGASSPERSPTLDERRRQGHSRSPRRRRDSMSRSPSRQHRSAGSGDREDRDSTGEQQSDRQTGKAAEEVRPGDFKGLEFLKAMAAESDALATVEKEKKSKLVTQEKAKKDARNKKLAGVFAFGMEDEDEEAQKATAVMIPRKAPVFRAPSPVSSAANPGGSSSLAASGSNPYANLSPAQVGQRLAEFKKGQIVNGRRVFKQIPDELRNALVAVQRSQGTTVENRGTGMH